MRDTRESGNDIQSMLKSGQTKGNAAALLQSFFNEQGSFLSNGRKVKTSSKIKSFLHSSAMMTDEIASGNFLKDHMTLGLLKSRTHFFNIWYEISHFGHVLIL